jgi:hypothetical protein
MVTNSADAIIVAPHRMSQDVVEPQTPGSVSITAGLGAITSSEVHVSVTDTKAEVVSFGDLIVPGTSSSTIAGVRDVSAGHRVEYSAQFEDGTVISREAMFSQFDPSFRTALATFETSDADVLSVAESTGLLVPKANNPTTTAITVKSAANPSIQQSIALFTNLLANGIDADLATDVSRIGQRNPLQSIAEGEIVRIKVYVSTGSALVGSLTMELDFDPTLLTFNGVEGGADDAIWSDTVAGEVRSDNAAIVRFGGITTNYASGNDWHFATVSFLSTGDSGAATFGGRIVEIADDTATNLLAENTPIDAGDDATLLIGAGFPKRTRRALTQRARPTALSRVTRKSCDSPVLGDVNQDCKFSGNDALLTAQYTLVNDNPEASAAFLEWSSVAVASMDADFNNRTDTRDTTAMLNILFGGLRFAQPPALVVHAECKAHPTVLLELTLLGLPRRQSFS